KLLPLDCSDSSALFDDHESASLSLLAATLLWFRSRQACKELPHRQRETWQHLTAVQRVLLGERARLVRRRKDLHRALRRVHEPDNPHAGQKILLQLAHHFPRRVASAEHFDG